ncbi:hypothetical protein MRX96_028623 [Rhipicephalus microplus]
MRKRRASAFLLHLARRRIGSNASLSAVATIQHARSCRNVVDASRAVRWQRAAASGAALFATHARTPSHGSCRGLCTLDRPSRSSTRSRDSAYHKTPPCSAGKAACRSRRRNTRERRRNMRVSVRPIVFSLEHSRALHLFA